MYISVCVNIQVFVVVVFSGVLLLMVWCVIWSVAGPDSLPGGSLFGLLVIFYSAVIGGKILQFIRIPSVPQLPPLLGKGTISSHFFL